MSITNMNPVTDLTGNRIDLSSWLGWASWWEGGLDMGSGISTVYLQPVRHYSKERTERGPLYRLSIPSVVDTGEGLLARIANGRAASRKQPAAALLAGEFVLRSETGRYEHLVGGLADLEGEHPSDAKGDPSRYWGEHMRIIAQTLFGAIIPDVRAQIRLTICMPFSLYTPENKERAISNLDGIYRCYINEVYRELDLRVGSVVPEGYAAITKFGSATGNNVAIDIGDRTTEIIFARGYQLVSRDSDGKIYGVRQLIEGLQEEFATTYGKSLEIEDVRILLKGYTARARLPRLKVPKGTTDGHLDSDAQYELIARKTLPLARALATFIRATLNKEGAEVGSNLENAIIYGGGSYLFHGPLSQGIEGDPEMADGVLRDLYLPVDPEYINAAYLQELVAQLSQLKPDIWER